MSFKNSLFKKIEPELLEQVRSKGRSIFTETLLHKLSGVLEETIFLSFSLHTQEWRLQENFTLGLGSHPIILSLQMAPLKGDLFWIMGREEVHKCVSLWHDLKGEKITLENQELILGLYRYISLVAIDALAKMSPFQQFSLKFTEKVKLPVKGYILDTALHHKDETLWGRIILSEEFKREFEEFLAKKKPSLKELDSFKDFPLQLSIQAGSVELSHQELNHLEIGDVILLDNARLFPKANKGSLTLALNQIPLFQLKFKEGSLKILDYIYSYEEVTHVR